MSEGESGRTRGGSSAAAKNIVNVILVDIRAWDTYGEVTVLIALAATGGGVT